MGTESANFEKSVRLPLAVIIFQSARFHLMFNSVAAASFITQIADLALIRVG
jgi:hypothetical protein